MTTELEFCNKIRVNFADDFKAVPYTNRSDAEYTIFLEKSYHGDVEFATPSLSISRSSVGSDVSISDYIRRLMAKRGGVNIDAPDIPYKENCWICWDDGMTEQRSLFLFEESCLWEVCYGLPLQFETDRTRFADLFQKLHVSIDDGANIVFIESW